MTKTVSPALIAAAKALVPMTRAQCQEKFAEFYGHTAGWRLHLEDLCQAADRGEVFYAGYHKFDKFLSDLADQVVPVPRGIMVLSRGKRTIRGRKGLVECLHVLCGRHGRDIPIEDPEVRWSGTGNYWASCSVNQVILALRAMDG